MIGKQLWARMAVHEARKLERMKLCSEIWHPHDLDWMIPLKVDPRDRERLCRSQGRFQVVTAAIAIIIPR